MTDPTLARGQRVQHPELGDGVVLDEARDGVVKVFFQKDHGERLVPIALLRDRRGRSEQIVDAVAGAEGRARRAWLSAEAIGLPLVESAAALSAAKIDLLPHQIVLTHRVAQASPRRYLVADEVGLGKTIEAALILRELTSRGELRRALMVVPAGLVNNWHRELNEVFHLGFEVFGSEGDVTDRKTNAFARHDRLIASIDTLKQPARMKRLEAAPPWDLIVFDEAHHLTATKVGKRVQRTENYKLAELLRLHCRDLLLLSATPHQGDHFRFWMLVQLLDPTLFRDEDEMIEQRHRLNSVVFRRTKADACRPDGSPLFSRRTVSTDPFEMNEEERTFYEALGAYLRDGFALARQEGGKGRALGFVMSIFQKIAASSFAAVRATLRRRLLALTVHEAILRDRALDLDGRRALDDEARVLLREDLGVGADLAGSNEVERALVELRGQVLRRIEDEGLAVGASEGASEADVAAAENIAAMAVAVALPEERQRIRELLASFPESSETKLERLVSALAALWQKNPQERVVIFATYLATVAMIEREVLRRFPGKQVVILKGGDHGAKTAAEKRFRHPTGPRVMICTAAGREGINLQFARVLFNFDLPWNPMDIEQRIGRIHRYGQKDAAQVYNLVLSDTLEGSIFLMLQEKLDEIARAVGKVDEHGNVAEDLQMQILGQLSERINYGRLYEEALSDPELRRTKLELEAALHNAKQAREVVFELFQDLERFSLEDYRPLSNVAEARRRLLDFMTVAVGEQRLRLLEVEKGRFELQAEDGTTFGRFCLDPAEAEGDDGLDVLGLDHPVVKAALDRWAQLDPESLGVSVAADATETCVLTMWRVNTQGRGGERRGGIIPIGCDRNGRRKPAVERAFASLLGARPCPSAFDGSQRAQLLKDSVEPMLEREVRQRGIVPPGGSYTTDLLLWAEFTGSQ